ncbi:MAG: DUF1320 domain-containing protein [Nitrospinota bacterium]|nr:DUF1320 domain-containing protein [Nitrospinota bacterium]
MSYITQADLETRFGADEIVRLADRDGDSAADAEVVAAAIADADALIDSYLAGRFTLPLTQVPTTLVRLACAIARYHLYDDKPGEHVAKEYSAALRALEKIANGEIHIGVDGADPAGSSGAPESSSGASQFDDLTGY